MKKLLVGLGFALTGIVADGFMLLSGAAYASSWEQRTGPQPLWNAIVRMPGSSSLSGLRLGIPLLIFTALAALGAVLALAGLLGRKEAPYSAKRIAAGLALSVTGALACGFVTLTAVVCGRIPETRVPWLRHYVLSRVWALRLEIPLVVFGLLMLGGLVILFLELTGKGRAARRGAA